MNERQPSIIGVIGPSAQDGQPEIKWQEPEELSSGEFSQLVKNCDNIRAWFSSLGESESISSNVENVRQHDFEGLSLRALYKILASTTKEDWMAMPAYFAAGAKQVKLEIKK